MLTFSRAKFKEEVYTFDACPTVLLKWFIQLSELSRILIVYLLSNFFCFLKLLMK